MSFPIDLSSYKKIALDPAASSMTDEQHEAIKHNTQLCRDTLVFFTAIAAAKGLGGHTGGAFDIVPEVMIVDAMMRHDSKPIVPIYFDEAGHRVAIQYLMSVLNGHMEPERLFHYREYNQHLPGHPELGHTPGIGFSSGRLGHMWPYANGVALANPDQAVVVFGSDGSQMEGNDAEAARIAVSLGINIKILVDANDVTIAGKPSSYLQGFDIGQTLAGHGVPIDTGDPEDLEALHFRIHKAMQKDGPAALINVRRMAVGMGEELEGEPHAHDVIPVKHAVSYLEKRGGFEACIDYLNNVTKGDKQPSYPGSSDNQSKNRSLFGSIVVDILGKMSDEERRAKVMVIDPDLEGSTGIAAIRKAYPEIYHKTGVMERGAFSAAAGFGMNHNGKQGIFATFSAFQEMILSELTMARLNKSNVLCHFSHSGVDDMADSTCHFGINNLFADNGLPEAELDGDVTDKTRLYFPADGHQMRAMLEKIFFDEGCRFVYSNRSAVPNILGANGREFFDPAGGYTFEVGKDDVIREGTAGYVVSYGSTLYRALGAVEQLRKDGLDVGLINKCTLNVVDPATLDRIGKTGFCLVAEEWNVKTGLGSRFGTDLLRAGAHVKYNHIGTYREGPGGLWQQMGFQGLDPEGIAKKVKQLAG
ncbi:MAG: transketolase C-terminal domain-containing protein [Planctomycetota bacterium]